MDDESLDSSDLRSDQSKELYMDDEEEYKETKPAKSRSVIAIKKTFNKPPLL